MKAIIIVAALTALTSAAEWTNLRVRWGPVASDPEHVSYFLEIPRTAASAISEGWISVPDINDHPVSVYCMPQDGRFCIITDCYGNIAGFQAGILASDVENKGIPYSQSNIAAYKKKTIFGDDYWTATVYTVDPAVIDAGGRPDAAGLTGTTGVWIEEGNSYKVASRNLDTMLRTLDYHEELCIPTMGTHYYYAMNESLSCDQFQPFFLLYKDGDLLGLGFQSFGVGTSTNRVWYDPVDWTAIEAAIYNAPTCLTEESKQYGIISIHIFLVDEPWNITC